jgi:hypothetical protein
MRAVTVKLPEVEVAGAVTWAGTDNAALLLFIKSLSPPDGAGPINVYVQTLL